jgi:hypothetical protein
MISKRSTIIKGVLNGNKVYGGYTWSSDFEINTVARTVAFRPRGTGQITWRTYTFESILRKDLAWKKYFAERYNIK